jgi:cysteine-rich repeat protein
MPTQVDACTGKVDGDTCSYPGVTDGACGGEVCRPAGCGNGVVEPARGEVCDDGNQISFDGCSADCTSTELCGDGITDPVLGEACDCGEAGMAVEGCAMENSMASGATCRPGCKLARCGDGVVDPHETCDDGNVDPGDGCRADCLGRWTQMTSSTYVDLEAVWGTAANDVFAVGAAGTILHYDGTSWSQITTAPTPAWDYTDIWGVGTDVYAVANSGSGSASRLDHFDGTSWSTMKSFVSGDARAVAATSPTDIWVGGANILTNWNGAEWSGNNNCPTTSDGLQASFSSLWADPVTQKVWVANDNQIVCVSNGTASWTHVASVVARRVWGSAATDVWAVAAGTFPVAFRTVNGTTWMPAPEANPIINARSIGGSAGDVLLVGDLGRAMQFNGTSWSLSPTGVPFDLADAWGYSKGHAFLVGENGTILY